MEELERKKLVEIIKYAVMAPSTHNSQPWKFSLESGAIRIYPDFTRRLPVLDPDNRELYISLGCALENLVIALTYEGYGPKVSLFPDRENECLRVTFKGGHKGQDQDLFDAIPRRKSNRTKYLRKKIPQEILKQLQHINLENGVSLKVVLEDRQIKTLLGLVMRGDHIQLNSQKFQEELASWIRFNEEEAKHKGDGLSFESIGNPSGPRWLGTYLMKHLDLAKAKAKKDEEFIKSSPALIVFSSEQNDKKTWVNVGRSFERFALSLTIMGLEHAHLNQAVELPELKKDLQRFLGLNTTHPQLLIRVGYPRSMPLSRRRPIDDVLVETPDTLFMRSGEAVV